RRSPPAWLQDVLRDALVQRARAPSIRSDSVVLGLARAPALIVPMAARTRPFQLPESLLQLRQLRALSAPEFPAHVGSSVYATQAHCAPKETQSALMPIAIPYLIRALLISRCGEWQQSFLGLSIQLELYALRGPVTLRGRNETPQSSATSL